MFKKLYPTKYLDSSYSIDYEQLYRSGIRGLIYDIDNTLVEHGMPATERAIKLFEQLRSIGFDTCLISNNKEPRVKPFADAVGSKYVYDAHKPSRKNYIRAMELMGTDTGNTYFYGCVRSQSCRHSVDSCETDTSEGRDTDSIEEEIRKNSAFLLQKEKEIMNAKTELCCLIGNPVGHSLSPMIHNTLAERMDINMAYTAFKVESDRLDDAIRGAYALGIRGLNVTVPHKCDVIRSLVDIDELAGHIGAVNTLVRADGGYKGYNTDIIGLGRELDEENIIIKDNDVIILGAGGASKAITYLCASKGASHIWLLNRSVLKAQALADEVNANFGSIVSALALDEYNKIPKGKYPVIQTTSVGLYPDVDRAAIEDEEFYDYVSAGVDIIFNPAETKFMQYCNGHNAPSYNGLKMLLYQGIAAFELWYGVSIDRELSGEILNMMKKELDK